jgi:putative FmdB family regulatory protein
MHYDYECPKCKCVFDELVSIDKRDGAIECPDCGTIAKRMINAPAFVCGDSHAWSTENNGKGRRISQLDYGVRQPYYAKSQQEAIDEASRRGLKAIKTR